MAAALVLSGSKRSFFEDLPPSPTYLSKKPCHSQSSSSLADETTIHHFWVPYVLSQLRSRFPNIDPHVLETSLQQSGYDFDATVKSLNDDIEEKQKQLEVKVEQLPVDGPGWIELAMGEMTSATSVDDARARAARLLEGFEKSTNARVSAEIAQTKYQKEEETMMLKNQKEAVETENVVLKRIVHAQNEKYEGRNQELTKLKDLVVQKQKELRELERHNYGLELKFRESLTNYSNVSVGRFNPDVY